MAGITGAIGMKEGVGATVEVEADGDGVGAGVGCPVAVEGP